GIQCGHWLYHAPSLQAASFLAKQAGEEFSHVRKILRIFSILGEEPGQAHPAIRFLSTGQMGSSWGEHVTLEMALGEGLVLGVFYAMADTIPEPEIRKILETSSLEEQRHVEFGEREAMDWLKAHPRSRKILLAQALIQTIALHKLKGFVLGRLRSEENESHPVLARFDRFYEHSLRCLDARIERLGLSPKPLSRIGALERAWLIGTLPLRKLAARILTRKPALLTKVYLQDPALEEERRRFRTS
ncbi:MAG: ferritin-like domain-containing protein, partial [Bdellovibrionota bacterium]